jgi:hypothetical protein
MLAARRDVGELGHRFPQGGVVRNLSVRVSDGAFRKSRRRRIALDDRPLLIESRNFELRCRVSLTSHLPAPS